MIDLYDTSAESAIIGACLMDNRAIETCNELINFESFYQSRHIIIYRVMTEMHARKQYIDLVTLVDELRKDNKLDIVGGAAYVSELSDSAISSANIMHYVAIVNNFAIRRKLLDLGKLVIEKCQEQSEDIQTIKGEIDKRMLELLAKETSGYFHVRSIIPQTIDHITEDWNRKGALKGIPTGIPDLDRMTNGFQNGDFIIVGARPSVGKTASAGQMIINSAVHAKKKIGFFSLEMSAESIMRRLVANIGSVNSMSMMNGFLRSCDFASIQDAMGILYETQLYFNDTPNIGINDLVSEARRMKRNEGVEAIFVDYLGLVTHPNRKMARWEQVGEISRTMKGLARELNIPLIVLSQLTRDTEGKRPTQASLRDSGSVEQDADVILLLHREGEKKEDEEELEFLLEKQRQGPVGSFKVLHKKMYNRMTGISND